MNLKKRYHYFLYEPNKKGKRFHKWKWHVKMTKKGKILPIWKCHLTITKKHAYISIEWQLQTLFLTFIHKNKPLLSATSTPSCSPMAYNILLPWKILFVPTMWTLGNANTGLDSFFWFQNHSNYLVIYHVVPTTPKTFPQKLEMKPPWNILLNRVFQID